MKTAPFLFPCLSLGFAVVYSDRNPSQFDSSSYASEDVIIRDVAVIGGGSSGTYGAINLQELGQSVVVVEKQELLGGMVNTYMDPGTGTTIDYGVQAFWNISVVPKYFEHLKVPITAASVDNSTVIYVDFNTGKEVTVQAASENFTGYADQLKKYPDLLYSWNLTYPVPSDLLLPFSEFITKYSLQDIAYTVYFSCTGVANILEQLTVNVFKMFDESWIDYLGGGDVTTANKNNQELYSNALEELGSDALLSSTVVAAQRPDNGSGVQLVVKTPSGNKLIIASKLLISMPPLLDNMKPLDLDSRESGLFSQFTFSCFYTMLLNNTGLSSGYRYLNAVATNSTYNIPSLPAAYQITETRVPGIYYVWYASAEPLDQSFVEMDVVSVIQRLQMNSTTPQFLEYKSHTPYKIVVGAEAIANGFYDELNGLQGYRNTWYTGAAFLSQSSAELWNFTQALLPQIIAA